MLYFVALKLQLAIVVPGLPLSVFVEEMKGRDASISISGSVSIVSFITVNKNNSGVFTPEFEGTVRISLLINIMIINN